VSGGASIRPRQWQQHLIQLLRRRLERNVALERDLLVFAGPGAGKTLGALLAFRAMEQEVRLQRFLVFCHRTSIQEQWQKAARRLGLSLQAWPCSPAELAGAQGLLVTYQGAGRQLEALQATLVPWQRLGCLAIADEAHHLGVDPEAPESTAWGQTFLDLTGCCRLRMGLTGTPFRADNLAFCSARRQRVRQDDGTVVEHICPDLTVEPRDLIAQGDVRPLEFRFQDGWVEHSRDGIPDRDVSPLSAETRESWRARNLRRAIELSDASGIGQQLLIRAQRQLGKVRLQQGNAAGLVIARDIDHAQAITQLLQDDGNRVDLVHSQDRAASSRLQAFQQGTADWLVSIDMCAEGFDAPRLRVVAYLTTVVTRSRFLQGITRAVRMTPELAAGEPTPRHPSFVFAPADPLLMGYARSWALAEPYVIQPREEPGEQDEGGGSWRGPQLPLEAVEDGAGKVIRLRTPELPGFLKRG
jgi:superfamily II DNA or RNA helicase